ncbi:conserved hypothetical protein [Agrobacterium deltaense Zutra 3/1]|uniref:Transposase n=1 Tax=Agrobacterium deltaense Zutra 3/1 TaxID=1183427 RepID=A0A1S7P3M1_9HYPH|nr:conserved hypothetical protein [Agrobacterium deltaense Zutra 3/1]
MTEVRIHLSEFQLFCHIPTKKDRPEGRLKKTALSGGYRRLCKGMQWETIPWSGPSGADVRQKISRRTDLRPTWLAALF